MSLRTRIAAVASAAVALAVLGAAVGVYLAVRSDLRGQIDESLTRRAQDLGVGPGAGGPPPDDGARGLGAGAPHESHLPLNDGAGPAHHPYPPTVAPARFGGASGYVQFVTAGGAIAVPGGQGSTPKIALSAADSAIAARGAGRSLSDRTVRGTHLRVLTLGAGPAQAGGGLGGAIMIARPLAEVDRELRQVLLILLIVGVAGIAIAAALGALVARTALTPIARFTRAAETLTGRLDLSRRLPVSGRDELARLARSFNATLDELERSLGAQRQLIADASHELRTPIASLRANIQTLEHSARLPADEQASLRADIIEELDELTSLVSDVVELARGSRSEASWEDVRLDLIVVFVYVDQAGHDQRCTPEEHYDDQHCNPESPPTRPALCCFRHFTLLLRNQGKLASYRIVFMNWKWTFFSWKRKCQGAVAPPVPLLLNLYLTITYLTSEGPYCAKLYPPSIETR